MNAARSILLFFAIPLAAVAQDKVTWGRPESQNDSWRAAEQRRQMDEVNRRLSLIQRELQNPSAQRPPQQLAREQTELEHLRASYAQRKQSSAQISYDRAFDASESRAKKEFPWVADSASPFYQRMLEVDAELERLKIPLFNHPDKPYILAHIVAHEAAVRNAKSAALTR